VWPDNWKTPDLAFVRKWLEAHIADAAAAKKPLLLEGCYPPFLSFLLPLSFSLSLSYSLLQPL
jgi:hypothetical protein